MGKTLIDHKGKNYEISLEDSLIKKVKLTLGWVHCVYTIPEYTNIVTEIASKNNLSAKILGYFISKSEKNKPIIVECSQQDLCKLLNYPEDRISKALKVLLEHRSSIVFKVTKSVYLINPKYAWTFSSLSIRESWVKFLDAEGSLRIYELYKAEKLQEEFDKY